MATSGTFNFAPSAADCVLNAYARLQIRATELTQQHLSDAANEANLLQVEFANRQPNLWTSELYTATLAASTATVTLPVRIITITAAYISTTSGSTTTDTIITPISASEYASYPVKLTEGVPNVFWYNRQATPQITLYPVPDDATTYTLALRVLAQQEDVSIASGTTLDLPYRWLDAFTAGLAARLAQIYKPEIAERLDMRAERAWSIAAKEDVEDVPLTIAPMIGGYYS
jgi:hypothetical protein